MKGSVFGRVLALCMLCMLFALPVYAETYAGTKVQVGDVETLNKVIEAIFNEGSAHYLTKKEPMDLVEIEITADIKLTKAIKLWEGTNVHMYSTPGKKYTITGPAGTSPFMAFSFVSFMSCSNVKLTNLIFDGGNANCSFGSIGGSNFTIGEGVILQNFEPTMGTLMTMTISRDNQHHKENHFPNVTFDGATVRNNKAGRYLNYGGMMIYMYGDSRGGGTLTVKNSTFENNDTGTEAINFGGAIYVSGSTLNIENSTFKGNKSIGGGAVFAMKSEVNIKNSKFTGNTTIPYVQDGEELGDGGGALYLQKDTKAKIENTTFTGNSATFSGGAIQAYIRTNIEMTDCTFERNIAGTHGGAFCVADNFSSDPSNASHILLRGCTLTGNKATGEDLSGEHASDPLAPGGGAIYLHEYCTATLGANDEGVPTYLTKNESAQSGGAVYICFGGKLICENACIEENEAELDGGGVYVDGTGTYAGYSHENDGTFEGNEQGNASGGIFLLRDGGIHANTAGRNGGGVYLCGINELVDKNGVTQVMNGGVLEMTGGTIVGNTAMDMGGGVYVGNSARTGDGGKLTMRTGAIYDNIAGENGNTSSGIDDAGADVFAEGERSSITLIEAPVMLAYALNPRSRYVPDEHRDVYFEDWYDDYSDQDPEFGKRDDKIGTGQNTGRYMSSITPDRMVYSPEADDDEYRALILGYKTAPIEEGGEVNTDALPDTGDHAAYGLYVLLAALAAAACLMLGARTQKE